MTLVSPGVSVSVIDESVTSGTGEGTIPFILMATAQDKTTPDGLDLAVGTSKANAGKLYSITSQRELLQTFGDPAFQSVGGTQINGSPLNEYGLLAAYSYLGFANRAYIVRADIDLSQLDASVIEPDSAMPAGTIWFNTEETLYGINEVTYVDIPNQTQTYTARDISYVFHGSPVNEEGADGDYAIVFSEGDGLFSYQRHDGVEWIAVTGIASFKQPVTQGLGEVWVKTTPGSNGAAYVVSVLSGDSGNYVQAACPMFAEYTPSGGDPYFTDDQANDYYGSSLASGAFYIEATANAAFSIKRYDGAAWVVITEYEASDTEPRQGPSDGAMWYNADVGLDGDGNSTVDILVNNGVGAWTNTSLPGYEGTGSEPTVYLQSLNPVEAGATLVYGDLWIETNQLADYPVISKWSDTTQSWIAIDNSDQTSSNGILFADARVMPVVGDGTGNNNGGGIAPDLDIDVPDPDAYPKGMLLFNTRFSTRVVKEWNASYLVDVDANGNPVYEGRWVNASGNSTDGSPYMGTDAQRAVIVKAMQSALIANEDIRSEFIFYNIMATPGFPECIDEMVSLNIDRKETCFVLGDSPFDLPSDATSIQAWAQNSNGAAGNGQDGLVSADPYLGVYYPSGLSTNTDGSDVVVPSSHMMLRTLAYNDQVAYPWFAPAGLTRGRLSNASSVGYIDAEGEFVPVTLNEGQRDVLYTNNINPLAFAPGEGLVAFGQKTRSPYSSALDRINVARLINYIRYQAENLARPFLFEPNDSQTRDNVKDAFDRFMAELVTLRGLDDFIVVCDTSNNTDSRIDRNELWIDIAIVPIKAIEFIYIPIRIKNTGSI